jgi:protein-disulfide isomerase
MKKTDRHYFYITVGLFGVGIALGFVLGNNLDLTDENANQKILGKETNTSQSALATTDPNRIVKTEQSTQESGKISIDEDSILGNKDAKVTIVEFSDYECPTCKKAYETLFVPMEKEFIESGKVRYVFRDFPLEQHPYALLAAEAAECAGEQDHYFEMHSKLFANQDEWVIAKQGDDAVKIFKKYAAGIKLNADNFSECLKTETMNSEIAHDIADAEKYKVEVTPTYFINNKLYKGIQKYDALKALIEAELK